MFVLFNIHYNWCNWLLHCIKVSTVAFFVYPVCHTCKSETVRTKMCPLWTKVCWECSATTFPFKHMTCAETISTTKSIPDQSQKNKCTIILSLLVTCYIHVSWACCEVSAVWQTQAKSTEQIKCGLITNSHKKLELIYKKRQLHWPHLSSILLVYSIHIIPYEPNGTFHSSSLHTYTLITIMQICESHTGNGTH